MKPGRIIWKRVGLLAAAAALFCGLTGLAFYLFQRPLGAALRGILWKNDPALASEIVQGWIDFEAPPGYQPEKFLNASAGNVGAVIMVHREHPTDLIFIGQVPDGILANEEWRTAYEKRGAREIADQIYDTQTVETRTVTVRGQPTTLRLLEGTDKNGRPIRQLACMFKGKSGEILLVMVASQASWDQAVVDDFLSSIR